MLDRNPLDELTFHGKVLLLCCHLDITLYVSGTEIRPNKESDTISMSSVELLSWGHTEKRKYTNVP